MMAYCVERMEQAALAHPAVSDVLTEAVGEIMKLRTENTIAIMKVEGLTGSMLDLMEAMGKAANAREAEAVAVFRQTPPLCEIVTPILRQKCIAY